MTTPTELDLPPIIDAEAALAVDGAVWCDVRWYLDGADGFAAYQQEHIAGAIWVNLDRHLADVPAMSRGRHPLPAAASFAASLGELGIGPDDPVIAYDDRQGVPAGRMVWMLRAIGHEAALLDGGLDAWTGARSSGVETRSSAFHPIVEWPDVLTDADGTGDLAQTAGAVVIDARAGDRYRGEVEPIDPKGGHIPGAINLPYAENLGADGKFLDPESLRQRFVDAGVADAETVVHYCGSGVSACHNLLAMEHAGLGFTKLYPGSWSEWSRNPDRPIATGTERPPKRNGV